MRLDEWANNCSMVAFKQVLPHKNEKEIVDACLKAGFTEHHGMYPFEITRAADLLGLKYDMRTPRDVDPNLRGIMTLNRGLRLMGDCVCLIRITVHVLASNRGIPIDPNSTRRGSNKRVLGFVVIHNATIEERAPWANKSNPRLRFTRDLRHDVRPNTNRAELYDRLFEKVNVDERVEFNTLRELGYTTKLLRHHYDRGDIDFD